MHIYVKRNFQILDFDTFNDFYPVLCSHFCFLIEKITKGKNLCDLVEAHIHGSTDFFYQHWKCLQKSLLILMYFMCNKLETSSSTLEKKCCPETFTYSIEWNAMRKVCKLRWKQINCWIHANFPSNLTREKKHQHLGWGEVLYDFLGRSVHCDPRVLSLYHTMFTCNFATLAILDICLCNMCATKANKQSLHFVR